MRDLRWRSRYSSEDVGELIVLASRLDQLAEEGELSAAEVRSIGAELGVSSASLSTAVSRHRREQRSRSRAAAREVRRRMRFIRHVVTYAVAMTALLVVDIVAGGGSWIVYPAALWGAFVALHGLRFATRRRGPIERLVAARVARSTR